MNESSAIIPINPELERLNALITSKQSFSKARLAQMPLDELKSLQREWYSQAVLHNVLMLLQVLVCQAGKMDWDNSRQIWMDDKIEAHFYPDSGSLVIKADGALVCDNRNPGQEIFVPGEWLKTAMRALDRVELEKQRRTETQDRAARNDLITLLGANV